MLNSQKNASLISVMYPEILIVILIIYMHFVCIQNIFTLYYGTYDVKYCHLNLKIFWDDNNPFIYHKCSLIIMQYHYIVKEGYCVKMCTKCAPTRNILYIISS